MVKAEQKHRGRTAQVVAQYRAGTIIRLSLKIGHKNFATFVL